MVYIILCAIIWVGVYLNLAASKESMDVKPIRSVNDLFE
ncbi:hypothetical protein M2444_003351 [Paenibacillus sp. PastF-3]|jgi:hypothetical protein|nr:hypothetical protein [Paenibacillus sp. PastF-3]